jgi:hypothetical protein
MRADATSARARRARQLIFPTSITDKKILHQPSPPGIYKTPQIQLKKRQLPYPY